MSMSVHTVTIDTVGVPSLARWWATQLGGAVRPGATDSFALVDDAAGPRIGFRHVADPTPGKNRVHLDLTAADYDGEVERLVVAGATLVGRYAVDQFVWATLTDPEGNEFCLSPLRG